MPAKIALTVAMALAASAAQAQSTTDGFTLSGGVGFLSGDYGAIDGDTDILVAPVSLRYSTGPVRVWATLPYVRVDSRGTVFGGSDGRPIVVDPDTPMGQRVRKGIGDLTLGATYLVPPGTLGGFDLDLTGRLKVPTASESKFLGTGKVDGAVSADLSYTIGRFAPFVSAGYRMYGDPSDWDLRNGIATSVGTSIRLGDLVAIASYDYARSVSRFVDDGHELFAALSGPTESRFGWTIFGHAGLSEGSPDAGGGLLLTLRMR